MTNKFMLVCLFLFSAFLLFGCVNAGISVKDTSHCQGQLQSCNENCDDAGYWLASDREKCKGNCASIYQTCMG